MAYCSYCAAVLDPNLSVCPQCGHASAVAPSGKNPQAVRTAGILLLVSVAISILALAANLLNRPMVPYVFLIRTIGFWLVWIVLVILLWQRRAWVRIAILLLIAWNIGNIALTLVRLSQLPRPPGTSVSLDWSIFVTVALDGLRIYAAYLTFKPESTAWLKK
jgi:hypothetical protein